MSLYEYVVASPVKLQASLFLRVRNIIYNGLIIKPCDTKGLVDFLPLFFYQRGSLKLQKEYIFTGTVYIQFRYK